MNAPTRHQHVRRSRRRVQQHLHSIPPAADWHIDDHTREVGRLGLAQAKAALAACRPPTPRNGGAQHSSPESIAS